MSNVNADRPLGVGSIIAQHLRRRVAAASKADELYAKAERLWSEAQALNDRADKIEAEGNAAWEEAYAISLGEAGFARRVTP
jgi:hypothetical protein